MARVAVAGHSRGGKLAALQFAKGGRAGVVTQGVYVLGPL
jgi:acetyl esterase/lipase